MRSYNPLPGDFVRVYGSLYRIDTIERAINEAEFLKVQSAVESVTAELKQARERVQSLEASCDSWRALASSLRERLTALKLATANA